MSLIINSLTPNFLFLFILFFGGEGEGWVKFCTTYLYQQNLASFKDPSLSFQIVVILIYYYTLTPYSHAYNKSQLTDKVKNTQVGHVCPNKECAIRWILGNY